MFFTMLDGQMLPKYSAHFFGGRQSEDSFLWSGQTTTPKNTHDPAKTLGVTNLGKVSGHCGTPGVNGNRKTSSKTQDHFCKQASTHDSLSE